MTETTLLVGSVRCTQDSENDRRWRYVPTTPRPERAPDGLPTAALIDHAKRLQFEIVTRADEQRIEKLDQRRFYVLVAPHDEQIEHAPAQLLQRPCIRRQHLIDSVRKTPRVSIQESGPQTIERSTATSFQSPCSTGRAPGPSGRRPFRPFRRPFAICAVKGTGGFPR